MTGYLKSGFLCQGVLHGGKRTMRKRKLGTASSTYNKMTVLASRRKPHYAVIKALLFEKAGLQKLVQIAVNGGFGQGGLPPDAAGVDLSGRQRHRRLMEHGHNQLLLPGRPGSFHAGLSPFPPLRRRFCLYSSPERPKCQPPALSPAPSSPDKNLLTNPERELMIIANELQ